MIAELLLKIKEEELNSIIVEMRRNCTSLQEKLVKEETEKTVSEIFTGDFFWCKMQGKG